MYFRDVCMHDIFSPCNILFFGSRSEREFCFASAVVCMNFLSVQVCLQEFLCFKITHPFPPQKSNGPPLIYITGTKSWSVRPRANFAYTPRRPQKTLLRKECMVHLLVSLWLFKVSLSSYHVPFSFPSVAWCRLNYNNKKKLLFHPRIQNVRLLLKIEDQFCLVRKEI